MQVWMIEPRDPLIVRDGRPFDTTPGSKARSLMFPFPSTLAGAIRTHSARDEQGKFDRSRLNKSTLQVRGPLLVRLGDSGEIEEWYAPAPADALWLGEGDRVDLCALYPVQTPKNCHTDLPEGLWLVGRSQPDPRKPYMGAPRFWRWEKVAEWLHEPKDQTAKPSNFGVGGLARSARVHVSIDPATLTAREGALFVTEGLEFTLGKERARMALAVATNAENLREGVAPLGGERRLVFWRKSACELPKCPQEVRQKIIEQKHCRVVLLTPAYFEKGAYPTRLLQQRAGVSVEIKAMAVPRYQVVSGWQAGTNKPKPTRRLVPAGAVYYLKLDGTESAIHEWINQVWMLCISDPMPTLADGFGLAVLGTWDGEPKPIEWRS